MLNNPANKGSLLIETVIVVSILLVVFSMAMTISMKIFATIREDAQHLQGLALVQEGLEAVRSIRDYAWTSLRSGTYGLNDANGYWEFTPQGGAPDAIDTFTRTVTITDRAPDTDTKEAIVTVTWDAFSGMQKTIKAKTSFSYWLSP